MAAVTYLACTLLSDQYPYAKRLWIISASSGLAAIAFDWLSRRFDDREAKALRKEVEENKRYAEELRKANLELKQKIQSRTIPPEKLNDLLRSLGSVPKGEVLVGHDWMDTEAKLCAKEILAALEKVQFPARFMFRHDGPWEFLNLGEPGILAVMNDSSCPPSHAIGIINCFAEAGLPPMRAFNANNKIKIDSGTVLIWVGRKA